MLPAFPAWRVATLLLVAAILRINALVGLGQKVALAIEPIREGIVRRPGCRLFAQIDGDRQGFSPPSFPRATIANGPIARASIARAPSNAGEVCSRRSRKSLR
jgi:hypothetical protein